MKRRTLDLMFSIGGLGLAALLLVIGLVLTANANFAKDYVRDQLAAQKITFKDAALLTDEERQSACVVENAGQLVTTGKQAECYANHYIGTHLQGIGGGLTYAEMGDEERALKGQIEEAQAAGAPNVTALEEDLAAVTQTRDTLFKGETLRGLLLTSYGFSVFGVKGAQVATVAFALAGVLALLAASGLVHAFRTPEDEALAVAASNGARRDRKLVHH